MKSDIRLNLGLDEYSSTTLDYEKTIANSSATASNAWMKIILK